MKITDRKHLDQYRKEFLAHIDTQKKKVYVCGGTEMCIRDRSSPANYSPSPYFIYYILQYTVCVQSRKF